MRRLSSPAYGSSALAASVSAAALLSGCGGHTATTTEPAALDRGRIVFEHACAGCHTLTGHDTKASGGDLGTARLSVAQLESFVRTMPVRLSPAAVSAVSRYVHGIDVRIRSG